MVDGPYIPRERNCAAGRERETEPLLRDRGTPCKKEFLVSISDVLFGLFTKERGDIEVFFRINGIIIDQT